MNHIIWRNPDYVLLLKWFTFFETFHQLFAILFKRSRHDKIRESGNTYAISCLNSAIVAYFGVVALFSIWSAPETTKALIEFSSDKSWHHETMVPHSIFEFLFLYSHKLNRFY